MINGIIELCKIARKNPLLSVILSLVIITGSVGYSALSGYLQEKGRIIAQRQYETQKSNTKANENPIKIEQQVTNNGKVKANIEPNVSNSFFDDFTSDLSNWNLFGSPQPRLIPTVHERQGVFDNNGDGWCDSGAVSRQIFNLRNGAIVEADVYLDVQNQTGCWAGAALGFKRDMETNGECAYDGYKIENGIWIQLSYAGDKCWGTPAEKRRHAWFYIAYHAENGSIVNISEKIVADNYINSWHTLKILINREHTASFYIDDRQIYKTEHRLHPSVLEQNRIYLGDRSSGSAGKAFHDWVRFKEI